MQVNVSEQAPEIVDIARRIYKSYTRNSNNLTFDGRQCPSWEKLTPAVQSHWCAAALEAVRYTTEVIHAETQRDRASHLTREQARADYGTPSYDGGRFAPDSTAKTVVLPAAQLDAKREEMRSTDWEGGTSRAPADPDDVDAARNAE